jgi:regulator of cell morphogenesis and NO signaling
MALINRDSKLSDIILHDPSTITVLNRFGIVLGVGDQNVEDACREHGINVNFFTTILNTFINENYFPQETLAQFSATEIVDYLNKTNSYYEKNVLPNIERHFLLLINKAPSHNNNLIIMKQFFDEMKNELLQRIDDDSNRWFPEVCRNEKTLSQVTDTFTSDDHDDTIEDKIDDLINMLVMHLKGDYDHNLGVAVVIAIFSLKKDIKQNNRIRNRILRPISKALISNE